MSIKEWFGHSLETSQGYGYFDLIHYPFPKAEISKEDKHIEYDEINYL